MAALDYYNMVATYPEDCKHELMDKLRISAVAWTIIACIQSAVFAALVITGLITKNYILIYISPAVIPAAVFNFSRVPSLYAVRRFIRRHPSKIPQVCPSVAYISAAAAINFFFGGVFGIIGSAFDFSVYSFRRIYENVFAEMDDPE